jgi:hypothetical protein
MPVSRLDRAYREGKRRRRKHQEPTKGAELGIEARARLVVGMGRGKGRGAATEAAAQLQYTATAAT